MRLAKLSSALIFMMLLFGLFRPCALGALERLETMPSNADEENGPVMGYAANPDEGTTVAGKKAADFLRDAKMTFRAAYYGRARNNHNVDASTTRSEIHVNAAAYGLDFDSGYAWGLIGFDASLAANLGHGRGNSEVLKFDSRTNEDSSSVSFREAALKLNLGDENFSLQARGGFTPIRLGTIGTSGGLNPHGYRGAEAKIFSGNFQIGYAWADQFINDWDDRFRNMTNAWHQNRDGHNNGRQIDYIHSIGARYDFGPDKAAFVDVGVGEGKDYRQNAQLAASYPLIFANGDSLTFTGYYIWAQYQDLYFIKEPGADYHASFSAKYKNGPWTLLAGYGQSEVGRTFGADEMQFRLTPWANSDNRNFIQTWGQLDDFVWDGEKVVKFSAALDLSEYIVDGLSFGAAFLYGWDINDPARQANPSAWEFDFRIEYVAPADSWGNGFSVGVYPAMLRTHDFSGKYDRNDLKFMVAYSYTLDFLDYMK